MRPVFIWTLLSLGLANCAERSTHNEDPFRSEFLSACPLQKPYQSRPKERVEKYCACVYDQTLKGLNEDEAMTARFYLFGQSGIDVKDRAEFVERDMTIVASTMVTASNAIGQAVKRCGRP